jgi:DNA helicase II / ATP-dependent DNA helicase PcrA
VRQLRISFPMIDSRRYNAALSELSKNAEQIEAVEETGHCVVLAGPGSGKTKTLTVAMTRALIVEVQPPRGIACITYNNECALELETRLNDFGVEPSDQIFIGTVHSFALTQVIFPYARCVMSELGDNIEVASEDQREIAIAAAYQKVIGDGDDPNKRWKFAETKRRLHVFRDQPDWHGKNPELAAFVEAYETELRRQGLIDFDDMPLLALQIVRENQWVRESLRAKYPVLFVDEYQDLGNALHELVLLLCFGAGIRLFAVGDADQSMYGFLGADPSLLDGLVQREDVHGIRLRFNYRCGRKIIDASMAALGEERDYRGPDGAAEGVINFFGVEGDLDAQAHYVFENLLPEIQLNTPLEEVGILYRWAKHGAYIADEARDRGIPIVQSDNNALVSRSSKLSRFVELCARWASGGWKDADPQFRRLANNAVMLVYGSGASDIEYQALQGELIRFLQSTVNTTMSTHEWLSCFRREVLDGWRRKARTITEQWDAIDNMITRTDPTKDSSIDLPLTHFGGRIEGSGRLNLSTLHSAKGREFEVVILFAMNSDIIPSWHEKKGETQLRGARREFYVGVTRAKSTLNLVFQEKQNSPFVGELYRRVQGE